MSLRPRGKHTRAGFDDSPRRRPPNAPLRGSLHSPAQARASGVRDSSRFLILDFGQIPGIEVWQIGNEGGFLAAPVNITASGNRLLMGLAERADVIVDFTTVPLGNHVLRNAGPDEPFGGGEPDEDFDLPDEMMRPYRIGPRQDGQPE